jgi:hypothetical protein
MEYLEASKQSNNKNNITIDLKAEFIKSNNRKQIMKRVYIIKAACYLL